MALVDLSLILVIDVSFSVSSSEYAFLIAGYQDAFEDAENQALMLGGEHGKINVYTMMFSSDPIEMIDWTTIDSESAANTFAATLGGLTRPDNGASPGIGSLTHVADALEFAVAEIPNNPDTPTRLVIDVSSDGSDNDPSYEESDPEVQAQRDAAIGEGATINTLVITNDPNEPANQPGEIGIAQWYIDNVQTSDGQQEIATGFDSISNSITNKLTLDLVPLTEENSMAVTTDGYFSNSIVLPAGGGDFNIYDKHATPRYAVGTRITRIDGNEYVYSHFGADTGQGLIVAVDASESSVVETDNKVIAPASAATTTDGTIGNKFLQMTLATVTADQFAGGYFNVTDGTGAGYAYRIKGNTATGDPVTGDIRIELYEPLQVALDATSDVAITGCLYANLEAATAGTDAVTAGVSVSNMDVSEQAFGWVCVKGIAPINVDATDITFGSMVALSADVAGAIYAVADAVTDASVVADEEIIGVALDTPDDNSYVLVKCKIS